MAERRDWSWLEIPLLFGVLVAGAFVRYWLSTVVPFDAGELEILREASVRNHSVRTLFIMFSGLGLFLLYILARRSAGVPAAFALVFLLQTSVGFQEQALRIRGATVVVVIALVVVTYLRFSWPPWRPTRRVGAALVVVTALLAARGAWILVTLPDRMDAIRRAASADGAAFHASLVVCGGGVLTPTARLADCALSWPSARSLDQQTALLLHDQMLYGHATLYEGREPAIRGGSESVAVYDAAGVGLFVVDAAEGLEVAERVLGLAP